MDREIAYVVHDVSNDDTHILLERHTGMFLPVNSLPIHYFPVKKVHSHSTAMDLYPT